MAAFAVILLIDADWIPAAIILVAALVGLTALAGGLFTGRRPPAGPPSRRPS